MHQAMFARRAAVIVAALVLLSPEVAHADPLGWSPTWSDEFDGATLDATKWRAWQPSTPGPYNNERQEYLPSQATVAGGNLVITATNQPYSSQFGSYDFRSGRVESNFAQRHGRFEIRADLPGTKGAWPALWLLPDVDDYSWPTQGEIDILENKGHQPTLTSSAFHFRNPNSPNQHLYVAEERTSARFGQPENYHTSFHTYAVEWDATKIRYFVDDVHWYTTYNTGTFTGSDGTTVSGFLGNQSAPMQVVLNLAVGGDFLGSQQPDSSSSWPQQLLVDYVRVYERSDDPIAFQNGDFEAGDGSLAQWSVFGNRQNTNNVSVHNEAAQGDASLKLFGQFTGGANSSGVSQGISVVAGDEVRASAESFIRSQDSIAGTNNSVAMKIEFYNLFGGRAGSSALLDDVTATIANAASPNDQWRAHELTAVAPPGAVEARLAFVFQQQGNAGGAVHIDHVSFVNSRLTPAADADGDGDVDADDLGLWLEHYGSDSELAADADGDGDVDGGDFLVWQRELGLGTAASAAQIAGAAAPEPWGAALAVAALARLITQPAPATVRGVR
jgi:beta-glucanase (GH16 family)